MDLSVSLAPSLIEMKASIILMISFDMIHVNAGPTRSNKHTHSDASHSSVLFCSSCQIAFLMTEKKRICLLIFVAVLEVWVKH